jgi:hypothetical protein
LNSLLFSFVSLLAKHFITCKIYLYEQKNSIGVSYCGNSGQRSYYYILCQKEKKKKNIDTFCVNSNPYRYIFEAETCKKVLFAYLCQNFLYAFHIGTWNQDAKLSYQEAGTIVRLG